MYWLTRSLFLALLLLFVPWSAWAAGVTVVDVACATTSTSVLAATSTRAFLFLQNPSDTDISLNLNGGAAVANKMQVVPKNYGSIWYDVRAAMPLGAITCIHGGSGTKSLIGYQID